MPGVKKETTRVEVPLEEAQHILDTATKHPTQRTQKLVEKYRRDFTEWVALMIDGRFNILLHGFGSKKTLLDSFVEEMETHGYWHMVVKGYCPEVTGDQVLKSLARNLDIELKAGGNEVEQAETIVESLDRRKAKDRCNVILVVHSLDGVSLRDKSTQAALSKLAENENFRMIASIDHVNATLLWDQAVLTRFRFLWIETPTYATYSQEIMMGDSKILGLKSSSKSRSHSIASLESLWASLTKNSQSVLVELVRSYYSQRDQSPTVAFWELYQICRSEFLVSSEASLRHVLTELRDHSVVSQRKKGDGSEAYVLLVDKKIIIKFLEEKGNSDLLPDEDNMDAERDPLPQGDSDSDSDQF